MFSTSRVHCLAAFALLSCGAGCATGGLFEAGRLREQVVRFRDAGLDEDRLVLAYDACEARVARPTCPDMWSRLRVVAIPLEELAARPPTPVDRFSIQRLRADALPTRERALLRFESQVAPAADARWTLLVQGNSAGVHSGFDLVPPGVEEAVGRFYAGALVRERSAWWVWPLLPVALAVDAVTVPTLMVLALPLFTIGD